MHLLRTHSRTRAHTSHTIHVHTLSLSLSLSARLHFGIDSRDWSFSHRARCGRSDSFAAPGLENGTPLSHSSDALIDYVRGQIIAAVRGHNHTDAFYLVPFDDPLLSVPSNDCLLL